MSNADDKKIILGTADMMRLFPLKHDWAWDYYLKANHNHWLPNDIQMNPDTEALADPTLDPKRIHLFKTVFAQLTTFDILRGFDIADGISHHVTSPEIKMYLLRQAYEEMLHTHSYQYVIESTSLDENEIYGMYKEVDALRARVEYSKSFSKLMESLNEESLHTKQGKERFLLAIVFYFLIFEGIWFALNLIGPVQAMARHANIFKSTAEQFQYIFRDESLHISFGTRLINEFVNENGEVWSNSIVKQIKEIMLYSMELELNFIKYALPSPIIEYSIDDHIEMAYWMTNQRLHSIGIQEDLYSHAKCTMPWIHEQIGANKESNFFERKPTEYQKGALNLDDITSGIDDTWSPQS